MITKWSEEAKYSYNEVLNYLFKKWTKKEVKNFHDKTFQAIENIKFNPYMYPCLEENSVIRKAKISKQISLIYSIKEKFIYLITFWNHYKNPETLGDVISSYH